LAVQAIVHGVVVGVALVDVDAVVSLTLATVVTATVVVVHSPVLHASTPVHWAWHVLPYVTPLAHTGAHSAGHTHVVIDGVEDRVVDSLLAHTGVVCML
jgi:hypothetical protein